MRADEDQHANEASESGGEELKGEKVATIMNKQVNAGTYDVSWNGRNTNGKVVPTGMYLYDVESDGRSYKTN